MRLRHGFVRWGWTTLTAFALAGAGCSDGDADDTGSPSTSAGDDGAPTSGPTSGDDGDDDGVTSVGDGGDDVPTTGPTSDSGDSGGMCEPQPIASDCTEDCECESGFCFFVPGIGGRCGECKADTDCPDGGCTPPNPLADPPQGSVCNTGQAGEGCMSSDVCVDDLVCGTIVDADPILVVSTCGECDTDADCSGGQLCSPTIDIANFSGQKLCVDPGSVDNGQGCDHLGSGSEACTSGICYVVNVENILELGVCGDCGVDADCDQGAGEVCMAPDIDIDTGTVTPPMCGVP